MKVKLAGTVLVFLLVATAVAAAGCGAFTCSGSEPGGTDATAVTTTTTFVPTSSSTTTSSTITTSSTTTTLSPMEAYRVAMRDWADTYGPGLSEAYTVISGANFVDPTPAQIQAAKDLDTLMEEMIPDLQAVSAPPILAQAHADFLASLQKMAVGIHDLAQALEAGNGLRALTAVATIGAAWQEGSDARTTLEKALGFSLSG